jgi:hypothetical protein
VLLNSVRVVDHGELAVWKNHKMSRARLKSVPASGSAAALRVNRKANHSRQGHDFGFESASHSPHTANQGG